MDCVNVHASSLNFLGGDMRFPITLLQHIIIVKDVLYQCSLYLGICLMAKVMIFCYSFSTQLKHGWMPIFAYNVKFK